MEKISTLFVHIISFVNTQQYYDPLDSEKNFYILQGLVIATLFIFIFSYLYYRYFWKNKKLRKLFLLCVGSTLGLLLAKYSLNFFDQTYVIERVLFFAFPSPRLESISAFLLAIGIFAIFLRLRVKIEQLPTRYFILAITSIFILFTLSVASMRSGVEGISEPFTHHGTEYTGALQFARPIGLKNFISQYSTLVPDLPLHPSTHPPGYVVFLYSVEQIFHVGYLGLAIAVVFVTGIAVALLYLFWESIYERDVARRMMQVLIFVPSLVFFSATSMDAFNFFIIWLAVIACFFGWKRSYSWAFIGGLVAGYALFSNYLFIFMIPLFLALLWFSVKEADLADKRKVLFRVATSIFAFGLFFLSLWIWADYFIITNYFAGYAHWRELMVDTTIKNSFDSLGIYLIYAFNSLFPFIWSLGAPNAVFLLSGVRRNFMESNWWFKTGVVILLIFLLSGIVLGGETGRIWLFLVPLFLMFRSPLYDKFNSEEFNAALCLLFFHIIVFQIAFHTYW